MIRIGLTLKKSITYLWARLASAWENQNAIFWEDITVAWENWNSIVGTLKTWERQTDGWETIIDNWENLQ